MTKAEKLRFIAEFAVKYYKVFDVEDFDEVAVEDGFILDIGEEDGIDGYALGLKLSGDLPELVVYVDGELLASLPLEVGGGEVNITSAILWGNMCYNLRKLGG